MECPWCILSQDIDDDDEQSQELLREIIKLYGLITIREFSMAA